MVKETGTSHVTTGRARCHNQDGVQDAFLIAPLLVDTNDNAKL